MPWKMVTRHGKIMGPCTAEQGEDGGPSPCGAMTLAEMVDSIFSQKEYKAKESKRREREKEKIGKKCNEYYETHMKKETERLNTLVDWYKFKPDEIREAPVDSRPRKLQKTISNQ